MDANDALREIMSLLEKDLVLCKERLNTQKEKREDYNYKEAFWSGCESTATYHYYSAKEIFNKAINKTALGNIKTVIE